MINAYNLAVEPVQPMTSRGFSEPEEHIAELLLRFVNGLCSPDERTEVFRMLRLHPVWLRWLADHVRDKRVDRRSPANGNS
jgi:hypothetical protein